MEIKNRQKIKETIKLQGFMLTIFWLIVLPLTISAKELGWVILFYAIPILFILLIIFLLILLNLILNGEIETNTKPKPTFSDNKIISFISYFFFIFSFSVPCLMFLSVYPWLIIIILISWIIYLARKYCKKKE